MRQIVLDGRVERLFLGLLDEALAIRAVPGRDLVTPPKLARNAPRLNVFHPVEIGLFPVLRNEVGAAFANGSNRRLGQRLCIGKPLVGQHRLDDDAGAVTERLHDLLLLDIGNVVAFGILDRDGQAFGINRLDDSRTRDHAVEAAILFRNEVDLVDIALARQFAGLGDGKRPCCTFGVRIAVFAHGSDRIHQAIERDLVTLGDLVIVEVMRAGDLDGTRAEIRLRIFVSDDRDQAAMLLRTDRDFTELADDRRVTLVRRMNGNRAVTQHGFRAGCGDRDVVAFFRQDDVTVGILLDIGIGFAAGQRVLEVPHVAVDFLALDFEIRNRRFEFRVPVDQSLAAIDQAFLVERDEDFEHRLGKTFIHGEAFA
ncbi:hypothetical protein D3C73_600080 [compost metagenome]